VNSTSGIRAIAERTQRDLRSRKEEEQKEIFVGRSAGTVAENSRRNSLDPPSHGLRMMPPSLQQRAQWVNRCAVAQEVIDARKRNSGKQSEPDEGEVVAMN